VDPVTPPELLAWVASADLGVMPNPGLTLNDQFSSPNKLFECLAAGTPVVASDFPTIHRIVLGDPDGPLGGLCDPSRIDSIIDAILAIAHLQPARQQDLRERCLRATALRWNWDREADTLRALYRSILPA
jgi:glycosyltransferase involved in cell wall biosynthesis